MPQLPLDNYNRHVDYHQRESNEIDYSEDAYDNVLMQSCTQKEDYELRYSLATVSSSQRVVDVSKKEVVHGEIPFTPILAEVTSVPPILIKTSIAKHCNFSCDVEESMEEGVEDHEPDIGCRDTQLESLNDDHRYIFFFKIGYSLFCNGEHVLRSKVNNKDLT